MPKNIDKRLPLNLDLDKLLLHYGQTPDTSAYEERKQRYAETRAKWLAENADRVNACKRAWAERNPEKRKKACANYYAKIKDTKRAEYNAAHANDLREKQRRYCEEHRDERAEYGRQYRETHREKIRAYKETHREEHKAYMKEYHRKRRCDVATTSSTV